MGRGLEIPIQAAWGVESAKKQFNILLVLVDNAIVVVVKIQLVVIVVLIVVLVKIAVTPETKVGHYSFKALPARSF